MCQFEECTQLVFSHLQCWRVQPLPSNGCSHTLPYILMAAFSYISTVVFSISFGIRMCSIDFPTMLLLWCLFLFVFLFFISNPDVMMESYAQHGATPIFYVIYLIITLYFASNVVSIQFINSTLSQYYCHYFTFDFSCWLLCMLHSVKQIKRNLRCFSSTNGNPYFILISSFGILKLLMTVMHS